MRRDFIMSGLLFLFTVLGFVLVVHWALRNDGVRADEPGTGLLAMRSPDGAIKQKSVPKWQRAAMPERSRAQPEKTPRKAGWQRSLQYNKNR